MWTEKDMIYLPPMIKLEYLKKDTCSLDYIGDVSCRNMDRDGKSQIRRMVFPFDLSMGIGYAISFLLLVPFFRRGLFYLW